MRLLYATSISFPSGRANRLQVIAMSKEFGNLLTEKFWLGGENIRIENSDVQSVSLHTARNHKLAWEYLEFSRQNTINSIYCREPRLLLLIVLLNKFYFGLGIKFIYEVHRIIDDNVINQIAERILSFFVDKYVIVTKHLADMYSIKYGLKKDQTLIAPDGVDLKIFDINISTEDARNKLNLPRDKKIIGYAGRYKTMGEDKGFFDILESLKRLPENVIFVAVGGKPSHVKEYQEMAEKLGLKDRVIFRDHQTQSIVAIYQKAFDILLMPFPRTTHYSYYMSPLKMFEYMASKRPIVASDLPSVREVLNGENAVLVGPGKPESLAKGIEKLLEDPQFGEKISSQAYEDAKKYTWERRTFEIFNNLK